MGITEKEIDSLINKIRDKYKKYGERYPSGWFNVEGFNDRLKLALKKRMNMEGFLLAEVKNLEDLKVKHENEEKKKDEPERPFTMHVNQIIEENTQRIKKYKEIKFHPLASMEISHFYGAMTSFAQEYFIILWSLVREPEYRNNLNKFDEKLSDIAIPRGKRHPKWIEDHALILSRRERLEIDIEKNKNEYLKSAAFVLHDIIDFTEKLIDTRNSDWEPPLKFDRLFIEGNRKEGVIKLFSGLTGYGAIIKIRDQASQIIDDFRLEAFRRRTI